MSQGELPEHVYAVILAGGSGTRFWPKSRQKSPKQLCQIGGGSATMLEITLSRLDGFVPPERRIIVTHLDQAASTKAIVGDRCPIVLAEPDARNTANALALAAIEVTKRCRSDRAVMISLHADHVIERVPLFQDCLRKAIHVAASGDLCLIGVVPKYPETGYGYIERGSDGSVPGSFRVASFREKPERTLAEKYVKSGQFYWNAGLFVFPVATLLAEMGRTLPATVMSLQALGEGVSSFINVDPQKIAKVYSQLPKISIDHAVLEVSQKVSVVPADIGWQDVGSWDALSECFPTDANGNFFQGDVMAIESHRCTVDTDGPLTAILGVDDLVVVHAKGAILVCPKNRAQDVKLIVDQLKNIGRLNCI